MTMSSVRERWRQFVAKHGLLGAVRMLPVRIWRIPFPRKFPTHPFDQRHGVDTSGIISGRRLRFLHPHAQAAYVTAYWGTAPSIVYAMFERWKATLPAVLRLEDYAFLDIGCGKGRIVLLASDLPFRQVSGIELHRSLVRIARRNLQRWKARPHACPAIEVFQADALTHPLPDGPLLLYLFHPFTRPIMEQFVARLLELACHRIHPLDVLYMNPEDGDCFLGNPAIRSIFSAELAFSPEDSAADVFGSDHQRVDLYRFLSSSD